MTDQIQKIVQIQDHLDLLLKQLWEVNKENKNIEKTILCNSGAVEPGSIVDFEISAGRGGAFKPFEIQMHGIDETGQINHSFEIVNVTIMGMPQLVNYNGSYCEKDRGLIKTFENFTSVGWQVFGASQGQGLQISIRNMNKSKKGIVYVALKGCVASCDLIGRA